MAFTISETYILENYEKIVTDYQVDYQGICLPELRLFMQFKDDTELYRTISVNIKHYRELAHLTQNELAEKSHLSLSYITKLEASNCNKSVSLSALHQIARALDQDMTLFFETEHDNPS